MATAPLLRAMLDHAREAHLRSATTAETAGGRVVYLDLRRVTFADSQGLAPILHSPTVVLAASAPVWLVLRLLGHQPPYLGPLAV